jgi:hypothetical protein
METAPQWQLATAPVLGNSVLMPLTIHCAVPEVNVGVRGAFGGLYPNWIEISLNSNLCDGATGDSNRLRKALAFAD